MASHINAQAVLIGQKAAELLSLPGYVGRVLAVVSSAVYLAGHDGQVLWLGQAGLPAHRRCVLASFHAENVEAGMEFSASGTCLRLGSDMVIELANANLWMPRAVEWSRPPEVVQVHLTEVLEAIRHRPLKGLGYALAWITRPAGCIDYSVVSSMDALLLHRAEPIIQELVTACRRRDLEGVMNAGLDLVGLGPGLTPSGDDYLGGLLFSAHHLRAADGVTFEKDGDLLRDLLCEARPLTTRVSHTILSDLAHGHGPAPLHDLLSLLVQGSAGLPLRESVQQLIAIGHSSGWDMLAGALTGMLLRDPIES
jgi:hypothetical protein